jgi:hypothetical protein
MSNDLRLERRRAIAANLQAHDRRRLARPEYDPSDLTPSTSDPSILVSHAGLDRGTIEVLRHLDLVVEGTRTVRYDAGRARPYLRNRAGALPIAPGSPAHYARAKPEVIGKSANGASLSKSIFAG